MIATRLSPCKRCSSMFSWCNMDMCQFKRDQDFHTCNIFHFPFQFRYRFFPNIRSITELSQSSNMRFMQFRAHDKYALHLSKMEKVRNNVTVVGIFQHIIIHEIYRKNYNSCITFRGKRSVDLTFLTCFDYHSLPVLCSVHRCLTRFYIKLS